MKFQFTPEELHAKQEELELLMFGNGVERFNRNNDRAIKEGNASDTAWFRRLAKEFLEPFAAGLQAYIDHYICPETGKRRAGKPSKSLEYLQMLEPTTAAYVAMKIIFDYLPVEGVSAQMVADRIGRRIEDQVRFTRLEGAAPKYVAAIKEGLKRAKSQNYEHKNKVLAHAERSLVAKKSDKYVIELSAWVDWPKTEVVKLGSLLVDIFEQTVRYKDQPIIEKAVKDIGYRSNKSVCYIQPTEIITEWIEEFRDVVGQLNPCYSPCVIPPRNWTSPMAGGYHTAEVSSKLKLIKADNFENIKRLTTKQMPKVYQAVNKLQQVKWSVNEQILAVARDVLRLNRALAMPSAEPLLVVPAPIPLALQHLRGAELRDAMTPEQWERFLEWKRESAAIYSAEQERRSKYLDVARTIGEANRYAQFEHIYFVYTLDFRGRIYSQSSLLSPQGADLQKGLLHFGEGKPLGKSGKYWLAVQGAGTWGEDKCSFADRVKFIEGITEDVRDYATDPLTFTGWAGADKPWQFLSWCFEWSALQDWIEAGNKEEDFVSRIPVAMDGSCSGIQHYSALLRDEIGGAAVNLVPSERPQDIYGEVAKVAVRKLQAIIDGDSLPELKALAQAWLDVGFTRGLTKKSVMTLPYGSTQMTCRESVEEYLDGLVTKEAAVARAEGRKPNLVHPFVMEKDVPMSRKEAVTLASGIIWNSIGEVVVAARAGMAFIKNVTKVVAGKGLPLEWITPTGFIVNQAIYEMQANRVMTQLMGGTKFILLEPTEKIDTQKMQSSCAPNYIHSMDASHLTLAVCEFDNAGIDSIAVIHDSFGTHAGTTGTLRELLSGSFVSMYEECNWLQEFKSYCETQLLEEIDVEVPPYANLDLQQVRQSSYCFA